MALRSCLCAGNCDGPGCQADLPQTADWPGVGNDPGCMRYSGLGQINRENVARLKPAWTFHTLELEGRTGKTIECTPIVIDGVMYITTAYLRVVALDAATGKEIWQFDPLRDHPFVHRPASGGVNRGCAYWSDRKPGGERRIIHGTSDGRVFSLDATSGKLDPKFGKAGICNLRDGLEAKVAAALTMVPLRRRRSGTIRSSSAFPVAKGPGSQRRATFEHSIFAQEGRSGVS